MSERRRATTSGWIGDHLAGDQAGSGERGRSQPREDGKEKDPEEPEGEVVDNSDDDDGERPGERPGEGRQGGGEQ